MGQDEGIQLHWIGLCTVDDAKKSEQDKEPGLDDSESKGSSMCMRKGHQGRRTREVQYRLGERTGGYMYNCSSIRAKILKE